jgi:hypothetical protein
LILIGHDYLDKTLTGSSRASAILLAGPPGHRPAIAIPTPPARSLPIASRTADAPDETTSCRMDGFIGMTTVRKGWKFDIRMLPQLTFKYIKIGVGCRTLRQKEN